MSIRVALNHKTTYHYDRLVSLYPQIIRLRPAPHCRTPILSYSLRVEPKQHFLNWQQDPHGNYLARFVFPEQYRSLQIEVDLVAEMTVVNPFDFFLESYAEEFPFTYESWLTEEIKPYLVTQPVGPALTAYLGTIPREKTRTVDFLVALNQRLQSDISYLIRLETGVQTAEQTLASRSGSCRDSAWLLVQILRNLGLAARFVSGYLIQLKPDIKPLDGPAGAESDFTDLHAWTEVYLPGAGWVGLDPTSGLFAGEGHIPLACTPDFASASPITGSVDPNETTFAFSMNVSRIHEDPRVTQPYRDDQWEAIEQLGYKIDRDLASGDVRLTMGGEPTFVSMDNMDGQEWNFTALGPDKRRLAGQLIKRLRSKFAPGGLLHYGQGKWYPGEPLPRWALGCYWRKDGQPIWNDPDLIADDDAPLNYSTADALRFLERLSERLAVDAEHIVPAYEDAWHYMWRERRLPVNVDPLAANLKDEQERLRLAKIFERGLGSIVGYALPLAPSEDESDTNWQSGAWFFRHEHMFLLPGDSPMGLRLPLDSLPWVAAEDYPTILDIDPFAPRGPLPGAESLHCSPRASNGNGTPQPQPRLVTSATITGSGPAQWSPQGETTTAYESSAATALQTAQDAKSVVRTALCAETRNGTLYLFMPPVARIEDYLSLVSAIEDTARELSTQVVIEGYTPPHDHRLRNLKITPDPGVIEVNVQPASNWAELVANTTTLYDEARLARLATEKFMLDGRHSGTGGGNHIVIGGETAADSPILRRPDLLRSLLCYWNNHPSLSYLFSGTFVGPTSQAPRVDEARHESLYELETAFQQVPEGDCPPWLVDRLFRNLLTDLTGNTHRAEFCIDKLFSPDSSTGRLGLLEMRAFEMPPHARMSLTQQLLLRGLISWFWRIPYRNKPVRWGTALHDRFLLPHFVRQDFNDVLWDLRSAGYEMEPSWFDSHFEFRFPACGHVAHQGLQLELRQAIEPWNVLGEEATGGGTSRSVDSSVERLQVKVTGMTDPRHAIICNRRRIPLQPTGTPGEFVAGIRYRAWQPPACLHPTIGVHTPLVFDIFDTWNERAIGGCTWHVSHPGGRNPESFPVNAYEAESRRAARFFKFGHTPGKYPLPPEERNPDFPFTLDLRRATE